MRQEAEGLEAPKTVHFTFLIGCIFVAFVLGAFLSGLLVSCYCSQALQKAALSPRDPEGGVPRPLSLRSLAKMNGHLLDGQAKDGGGPKLQAVLLPSAEKEPPGLKDPLPELSGLPTPESTPELPLKTPKTARSPWERNQNSNNAKEAQLFHTQACPCPSGHRHGYEAPLGGYLGERKGPGLERGLGRYSQCYLPSGVEVTTLEELLRHLHEAGGCPRKGLAGAPLAFLGPGLPSAAASFANRVQPKIPDVETAPYYSSSTLPRDSLPRRLDVPPDPLPPEKGRPPAHRHSLCAAPRLVNVGGGGVVSRHHSLSQAGRQQPPQPLLTRMHSTGSSLPQEGHPLFLPRQLSYGDQGHGGLTRSVSLLKPGLAPKPLFAPSSPPAQSSGPFKY